MKSGSLNLLEPSGPHRACYGNCFTLPLQVTYVKKKLCCQIWYSSSDADVDHVFFDITSCRLVKSYKPFEGSQFLHREGQGVEVLSETSWFRRWTQKSPPKHSTNRLKIFINITSRTSHVTILSAGETSRHLGHCCRFNTKSYEPRAVLLYKQSPSNPCNILQP